MIIGVTGLNASGKSEVAKYLEKKGFLYISANKVFSEEAKRRGLSTDREDLKKVANSLREELGNNAFVLKAKDLFKTEFKNKNIVIESLRNPGEIEELMKYDDFYLLGISTDIKLRYERAKKRNRDKDVKSFADFVKSEEEELQSKNPNSQQLLKTYSLKEFEILNNDNLENLYEKVDILLKDISSINNPITRYEKTYFTIYKFSDKIIKRPFKNKYYLNIAKEVSSRSTCLNVRYGALILKDDQIISTGYVGAPRKVLSSLERGNCLRRDLKIPSGQRYEICRSVHAEQNAIINSARAGVSLLGSTMFFWGAKYDKEDLTLVNGLPCFICKKMIINAGIRRFISHDSSGRIIEHDVKAWQKAWSEADMLDDVDVYKG
jgi:dCMP deaminase